MKDTFASCLQYFSSKNVLTEHKKVCSNINGTQSSISFSLFKSTSSLFSSFNLLLKNLFNGE